MFPERDRGQSAVYYTSPQSFIKMFSWFIKLSVQKFQPLIIIFGRSIFVYHQWGCAGIYRPLSYPFRTLVFNLLMDWRGERLFSPLSVRGILPNNKQLSVKIILKIIILHHLLNIQYFFQYCFETH